MAEEPIELIRIDDLLKARRRFTMAALPSWLGRLPALAFAVLSLVDGAFSFATHSLVAGAVFAGYGWTLEGRALGGILQLAGVGALIAECALFVQWLADAIRASSGPAPPPSMTEVWLLAGTVALSLLWGVFVTVRCQAIASHHPLGKSDRPPPALFWGKARALGLPRWKQISLTGLLGVVVAMTALGISTLLYTRRETMYDYSTRTHVLGLLGYSGCWANEHEITRQEDVMGDTPFNTGFLAGVLVMIGVQAVSWFIQSPSSASASALRMAAVIVQAVIGFGGATWLYARERGRAARTS
jgi:hypothetical protein